MCKDGSAWISRSGRPIKRNRLPAADGMLRFMMLVAKMETTAQRLRQIRQASRRIGPHTVRRRNHAMAMKSLLVPVDFSDAQTLSLRRLVSLLKSSEQESCSCTVEEPKAYAAFGNAGSVLVFAWPLETSRRISKLETRLALDPEWADKVSTPVKVVSPFGSNR